MAGERNAMSRPSDCQRFKGRGGRGYKPKNFCHGGHRGQTGPGFPPCPVWRRSRQEAGRNLQPAHHAQFEGVGQQFVLRVQAYAVLQLAAHLRIQFEREALFALVGLRAGGFETVGFRVAFAVMAGLLRDQQFERDILRPQPVEKNGDFDVQAVAECDALLRCVKPPQRDFRPHFTHALFPQRQAARRLESDSA